MEEKLKPRLTTKGGVYFLTCLSLYSEDVQRLSALIAKLKKLGVKNINKSSIVRWALQRLEESLDKGEIQNLPNKLR